MLVYLLKSAGCLAILFFFYKLFLEKENMHVFKRFYLLGALVLSLIIPAIVFTEYVEITPTTETVFITTPQTVNTDAVINIPQILEPDNIDFTPILWTIYFLGLLFFGLKFIKNLSQILKRIQKNPKLRSAQFIQVLLQEKLTPHTFFSYIFLNKLKYESNAIPKEVLLHEETHAQQLHSYDVIFVELLQVILWFNPFVYLLKNAIKLNHEFLADQAVLEKDVNQTTYQNTLLSYLSPDSEKKYSPELANAINYSSIKKRFTIMKTQTSKKAVLLRSLLLLPLLAILLYSFSQSTVEKRFSNDNTSTIITDIFVEIDNTGNLFLNDKEVLLSEITIKAKQLNSDLTLGQVMNFVNANILYNESQLHLIEEVQSTLERSGIQNIAHTSKTTSRALGRNDFVPSKYHGKTIKEAKKMQLTEVFTDIDDGLPLKTVWVEIKNENEIWINDELIALENLSAKISNNYESKEGENKLNVQIYSSGILRSNFVDKLHIAARKAGAKTVKVFTEKSIIPENEFVKENTDITQSPIILKANKMTLSNSSSKEKASQKMVAEYNKLAKSHNLYSDNGLRSRESEIRRVKHIYSLMTEKQRNESEIFPEYPAKKQKDASRKLMAEYNKLAKHYNEMSSMNMRIKKKDVDRLTYIYGLMSEKQKADAEPFPDFPPMSKTLRAPKALKPLKVKKSETYRTPPPPKEPRTINRTPPPPAPRVHKGEESDIPIPPVLSYRIDQKNLSKNLKNLVDKYIQKSTAYSKSVAVYRNDNNGSKDDLNTKYKELIHIYNQYKGMATDEGVYAQPKAVNGVPLRTPPEPVATLDHVIAMAKKNAIFYYNDKEISSDRAIELLKQNNQINIDSRAFKGERPTVKLSDKPIVIEN